MEPELNNPRVEVEGLQASNPPRSALPMHVLGGLVVVSKTTESTEENSYKSKTCALCSIQEERHIQSKETSGQRHQRCRQRKQSQADARSSPR